MIKRLVEVGSAQCAPPRSLQGLEGEGESPRVERRWETRERPVKALSGSMRWEGSADAGRGHGEHEVTPLPDGLVGDVLASAAGDVHPDVSTRRRVVGERNPVAERVVDRPADRPGAVAAAAGDVEAHRLEPDRRVGELERARGERCAGHREGRQVHRREAVGRELDDHARREPDHLAAVLAPEEGLARAPRAAAGRDGRRRLDEQRARAEARRAVDRGHGDVRSHAGVGRHAGVRRPRVGRASVDRGGRDAGAARAGRARGAGAAAGAAVRVGAEHRLAPVRGAVEAVAEAGVAEVVAAHAAEACDAVHVGAHGADVAAGAAVVGVGLRAGARAAAHDLAARAGGGAHPGQAGLAAAADDAAAAAVGRARADVGADVVARDLPRGADAAAPGGADLVAPAAVAAATAVRALDREVDADGTAREGTPAVGAARGAGGADRPHAAPVRAALARGARAAAAPAVEGIGPRVRLAAVEAGVVAVAEAGAARIPAPARDAGGRGVGARRAGVSAAAAVGHVGQELALAAVSHEAVAVAEAGVARVAADAAGADAVGLEVRGAQVAAGAAVREVVVQGDAGRTPDAARQGHAAVTRVAGELAAPVGAHAAHAADRAAGAAGALARADVDLAPVGGIAVAVGVAREAGEPADAGRAGRRGVVAGGAGVAAGAAAGEAGAHVGLAAVARGGVAVAEARVARGAAPPREADAHVVRAGPADIAAAPAVVLVGRGVDLAAVGLVAVAARAAREAGGGRVDGDVGRAGVDRGRAEVEA